MLKVWLYAYALGIASARRLEQRIREDLGLRYLAGGARPDNWALSAFRRRHARARLRRSIRQWQKLCDEDDPNEGAGTRGCIGKSCRSFAGDAAAAGELRKSGMKKLSRTDADARFLRERSGFTLGYTAEAEALVFSGSGRHG